jgi:LDH2 family malate/lactate/ureidoglycolate dehydrogenase
MAATATAASQRVRVDPTKLEDFMTEAYVALGMPREDARVSAWGVVFADLRGHESHGVSNNVFGSYVPGLRSGDTKARPNIRILQETTVTSRWDGDQGMGFVVGHRVMQWVIARAKEHGAAFAAVANSRHYGMAQCYSYMALEHDLIGYSLTNGVTPGVVPFQGRESRLGTNPISIAIPTGEMPPYLLDMATTTVAFGKLQNYERDGKPIPPTYALGLDGRPTTDPAEAIAAVRLLPLGANREGSGHKGYGLGLMVDIFCGGLSGHGFRATADDPEAVSHFFGAWRPDAFLPLEQFKSLMDGRLREMTETPPSEGYDRVLYAGLPEWESEREKRENGVPLHPSVVAKLEGLAGELGLDFDISR